VAAYAIFIVPECRDSLLLCRRAGASRPAIAETNVEVKVFEADGKTPGINSERTAQVIEWYKERRRLSMATRGAGLRSPAP
jgi:hypothetical protein